MNLSSKPETVSEGCQRPNLGRIFTPTIPGSVFRGVRQVQCRRWMNSVSNYAFISHKYGNKSVALCCSVPRGLKFQFIRFANQVSAQLRLERKPANQNTAGSAHPESVSIKYIIHCRIALLFNYNSRVRADDTPSVTGTELWDSDALLLPYVLLL